MVKLEESLVGKAHVIAVIAGQAFSKTRAKKMMEGANRHRKKEIPWSREIKK